MAGEWAVIEKLHFVRVAAHESEASCWTQLTGQAPKEYFRRTSRSSFTRTESEIAR